jgi:outer membrane biosynthesis protein TonB
MGSKKKSTKPKTKPKKKAVKKKSAKTKRAPTDAGAETATSLPHNQVASDSSGNIAPTSPTSVTEDTRSHADDEIDAHVDNDDEYDDEADLI